MRNSMIFLAAILGGMFVWSAATGASQQVSAAGTQIVRCVPFYGQCVEPSVIQQFYAANLRF